jgi:hypothetical protein
LQKQLLLRHCQHLHFLHAAGFGTAMDEGICYIEKIDEIVIDLIKMLPPETSGEELSLRALETLGIKTSKVLPMVRTSFESHRPSLASSHLETVS